MKEIRTISLNKQAFAIEYDAYQRLRDYLDDIGTRMPMDQRIGLLQDVETRMADLLQNMLFAQHTHVVDKVMVDDVIRQIGQPSAFGDSSRPKVKVDKSQNSGCGRVLGITLKVILVLVALQVLFPILAVVFALCTVMFGTGLGLVSLIPAMELLPMQGFDLLLSTPWMTALFVSCAVLVVGVPLFVIIYTVIALIRTRHAPKAHFWLITIVVWLLSLVGIGVMLVKSAEPVGGIVPLIQQLSTLNDADESMPMVEHRQVDPFDAVMVTGAVDVKITQSSGNQELSVTSNNLHQVVTKVEKGVLKIELADSRYTSADVVLTVDYLRSIQATAASEIEIDQPFRADSLMVMVSGASKAELVLDVEKLDVKVSGASNVVLEGQATDAALYASEASKLDAEWLRSEDMHVNASGASKVEAGTAKYMWIQAAGASRVSYVGYPKMKQRIAVGASSIRHD